jgi:cytochrome c556
MRGLRSYGLGVLVVWAGAVAVAQTPKVTTPAEFDKVMKSVGPANAQVGKAVKSGAFADARTALATVRQNLAAAETFWVDKKVDAAIKLSKNAVAKAEALEKAISGGNVDTTAAMTAFSEYSATCMACHKEFRTRDAEGNYQMRTDRIGGQ